MSTTPDSCPACSPLQDHPVWHPLCLLGAHAAGPPSLEETCEMIATLTDGPLGATVADAAIMQRKRDLVARIAVAERAGAAA